MHELPVTQSILDIALKHANEAGAVQIHSIQIVIGQFSSFIDDSVQFYWDMVSKDTLAEGAEIIFRRIDGEMQCRSCEKKFEPGTDSYQCPDCGNHQISIIKGKEFYVESIDID